MKKNLLLISILMLLTANLNAADELSTIPEEIVLKHREEQILAILEKSKQVRQNYSKNRGLASLNKEDKKWLKEWEKIWNDESDKDYLSMALEL